MIRYKKYQMTGEKSPLKGLWYARPLIEDTFDTERLAKHMANHNTPYSEGLIKGVLTDMISCTKELILDGKNVKLDDLATGELSNAQINLEGQLKEAYKYNVDGSEPGSENKPGGDGGEEENPLG